MSADNHLLLQCADCGDECRFEQPPCADGHGLDCPEWACVECGAAILLGPALLASSSLDEPPGVGSRLTGSPRAGSGLGDVRHRYVA